MEPLLLAILSLLIDDPSVQEAGLVVYMMSGQRLPRDRGNEFVSKFDKSASLNDRAIAAVVRSRLNWGNPNGEPPRDHLAEGVRTATLGFGPVATNALFRTDGNDGGKTEDDGEAVLLAAINDANPTWRTTRRFACAVRCL